MVLHSIYDINEKGHLTVSGLDSTELAKEYDGKITVGKCDVEENDGLAIEFGIRNIPTIVFMKDGEVVDKVVGAVSKATLEEKFKALL